MLIQALICILKTDLYMKNDLNLEREIGKKQGNFPFSLKGNWEKTRKFPFFPQGKLGKNKEISLFPSSLENRVKMWVRAQSGNREGNLYI